MASSSTPRIQAFRSDAAIAKGKAVKIGSDRDHVALGAANTDRCIGIAQNETTAAEDTVEVALPGGGAKAKLAEAVVAGNDLVSAADGRLEKPNLAGDEIIARAMEDGAADDLIAVEIVVSQASAAQ